MKSRYPQKGNKTTFRLAEGAIPRNAGVSFRTTEEIKQQIIEAAKNENLSMTEFLEKAVHEYLKK